jgi:hypothetical protein
MLDLKLLRISCDVGARAGAAFEGKARTGISWLFLGMTRLGSQWGLQLAAVSGCSQGHPELAPKLWGGHALARHDDDDDDTPRPPKSNHKTRDF